MMVDSIVFNLYDYIACYVKCFYSVSVDASQMYQFAAMTSTFIKESDVSPGSVQINISTRWSMPLGGIFGIEAFDVAGNVVVKIERQ